MATKFESTTFVGIEGTACSVVHLEAADSARHFESLAVGDVGEEAGDRGLSVHYHESVACRRKEGANQLKHEVARFEAERHGAIDDEGVR